MKRGRKPTNELYNLVDKNGKVIGQRKTMAGAFKAAHRLKCRIEPVEKVTESQSSEKSI